MLSQALEVRRYIEALITYSYLEHIDQGMNIVVAVRDLVSQWGLALEA